MVPNKRQLFIAVSDWGSYLGSHFSTVFFVGSYFELVHVAPLKSQFIVCFLFLFDRSALINYVEL
jgi:hypothetical protein